MRDRIAEAMGGGNQMVENLTRQNMALFENAMKMFTPFGAGIGGTGAAPKAEAASAKPAAKPTEDISELKEEMEAMRRQLAELSQRK
jgi:polyhydroxyalkanoate synthesis regulator protein